jgi:hypothetical protein
VVRGVPPAYRELADTIQHRLKVLDELIESAAGFRGTVKIATQKKSDERGVLDPGLHLENGRIADAADPIDNQDLVTKSTLLKFLNCERLSLILSDCWEFSEAIDNAVEITAASSDGQTLFYGGMVYRFDTQTPQSHTANECRVQLFPLPFGITVQKVTIQVTTAVAGKVASVGLYNSAGSLVLNSGTFAVATTGLKTATFTPVKLTPGMYYLAITSDGNISYQAYATFVGFNLFNQNSAKNGKGANTTGGALNSTLGTVTAGGTWAPVTLFES